MAAKVVTGGIAFLRNLLKKEAMKKSKDASGIMTLNKQLIDDVERQLSKWVESAKKQGQDIDKMGEKEIKYIVELNKPKAPPTLADMVEQLGLNDPKKNKFLQKEGEVIDMTGKKIDTSKPILGGKNVPEIDKNFSMETEAHIKAKLEGMNKQTVERIRRRKYEAAVKAEEAKAATDEDYIMKVLDPEDFAHGGRTGTGLNYLLGEDDQNSRVPFGKGKLVDAGRRWFLETIGAGAAGIGAAKSGLFGLLKGGGKKEVIKELTQVPINNIDGMPLWFKPLVNKVIKEGKEIGSTVERQIVHEAQLPGSKTPIHVTQDLNTGNVAVDIGVTKHGFPDGHLGQPVSLEYKAGEWIEPIKGKKGTKTKDEFWVEEAEFTGGHPENVKFEESTIEKFGEHGSNFDEVEKFAIGKVKKKTAKESIKAERAHWVPEGDDMASGGRVPLFVGGTAGKKLWQEFIEKLFLKSSNEIRQGKGIWKGLTQEQWIKKHDDLTKTLKEWEMGGKKVLPKETKEFFGMNEIQLNNKFKIETGQIQASTPTKTLEGIEKTGTIDISNPGIADEFTRFMKETDPKGYKDIEEKIILESFDTKGKKGHASGGRVPLGVGGIAGMLGE